MQKDSKKHNAIEKALNILNLFPPYNHELSSNEISEMLGYHKTTAIRSLTPLVKYGFLEQNRENRKFKLGPSVALLNLSFNRSMENKLVQLAKPYLHKLRDSIQETVVLEVLSGRSTVRAYVIESPGPLRYVGHIGGRLPINAAAGAKSILAYLDSETIDYILDKDLPRRTSSTVTDINQFKEHLKKIKADGIAFDMGEFEVDVCGMGAPVFDAEGAPVASVVVVTLKGYLKANKNSRKAIQLKKTARLISEQLKKPSKLS